MLEHGLNLFGLADRHIFQAELSVSDFTKLLHHFCVLLVGPLTALGIGVRIEGVVGRRLRAVRFGSFAFGACRLRQDDGIVFEVRSGWHVAGIHSMGKARII